MAEGKITGLAHIGIIVRDIAASIDYYKRLGISLDKEEITGIKLAFLSAGTCLIELVEPKETTPREEGPVGHVAMEVDDIIAAVKRANDAGIEVDASKIATLGILGGVKNVFFDGPDGEKLEFFEYAKK
ncbi:MAG: VOC family protein [Defluviitaleaceae bacterium]|nr:VOC family protein [Defluviitaleaceae bacterium]